MNKNKSGIKHLMFRVACCFVSGLLISAALMGTVGTYSWFSSTITRGIEVSAAGVSDILTYELKYHGEQPQNPVEIRLKGAKDISYNPVIYFSVSGEAAKYILHINPVRLEAEKEAIAPIRISINANQFSEIAKLKDNDVISGEICIKYLNEFIIEPLAVQFTGGYLKAMAKDKIEGKKELTQIITDLSKIVTWEEANWANDNNTIKNDIESMETIMPQDMERMSTQGFSVQESKVASLQVPNIEVPIGQLIITEEQKQILDAIIPRASEYLQEIYNVMTNLVSQLNEKMMEIVQLRDREEKLTMQVSSLEKEREDLRLERDNLIVETQVLKKENILLQDRVSFLEGENQELRKQLLEVEQEIAIMRGQSVVSIPAGGVPVVVDPGNAQNPGGLPTEPQPGTDTGQPADPGNIENPGEQPGDIQPPTGTEAPVGLEMPVVPSADETTTDNSPANEAKPAEENQQGNNQTVDSQQPTQAITGQATKNPMIAEQPSDTVKSITDSEMQEVESKAGKDKSEKISNSGIGNLKVDINKKEEDGETSFLQN